MAGNFLAGLGPVARVGVAAAPFAIAMAIRLVFGRSRVTEILIPIATLWFLVNVLIAPYSLAMQRDLHLLLHH